MTNQTPKYLKEIREHLDTIPYGTAVFEVKRVGSVTVEVTSQAVETAKRPNNEEYLKDIVVFLQTLERSKHSGKVSLEVDFKQGTITTLGYLTQTKKEYRK